MIGDELVILGWIVAANGANLRLPGELDDFCGGGSLHGIECFERREPLGGMRYKIKRHDVLLGYAQRAGEDG
jgi:hypothetical protein